MVRANSQPWKAVHRARGDPQSYAVIQREKRSERYRLESAVRDVLRVRCCRMVQRRHRCGSMITSFAFGLCVLHSFGSAEARRLHFSAGSSAARSRAEFGEEDFIFHEERFEFGNAKSAKEKTEALVSSLGSSRGSWQGQAKGKLVLFFSHQCPDCRYFSQIWNMLPELLKRVRAGGARDPCGDAGFATRSVSGAESDNDVAGLSSQIDGLMSSPMPRLATTGVPAPVVSRTPMMADLVELVAIEEPGFATTTPFEHYEIPSLFWVPGESGEKDARGVVKFQIASMDAFLEHRDSEVVLVADVMEFLGRQTGMVPKLDTPHGSDPVSMLTGELAARVASLSEPCAAATAAESSGAGVVPHEPVSADLMLGILAEHPGQELMLLSSEEFRAQPVAQYILKEKRAFAEAHPEEIIGMVAEFFDRS